MVETSATSMIMQSYVLCSHLLSMEDLLQIYSLLYGKDKSYTHEIEEVINYILEKKIPGCVISFPQSPMFQRHGAVPRGIHC